MRSIARRSAFALIAALLAGSFLTACGEKSPENVLVKVDDITITLDDFRREWLRQPVPQPGIPVEEVDKFIDDMIAEKLFIIEARRRKIDQDEKFQAEVEKYREQLMVEALLNQEVLSVNKPTEAEIEEYWKKNRDRFSVPPLTRFSHILIKADEGEDKESALARCVEVKKRLEDGDDFWTVAREVSEGSSAERGGDLGYYRPDQISPEFQAAARELKIDELSDPIDTDYGYHLIVVTARKPPREKTLEESRKEIQAILLAEKRKTKFDTVKSRLSGTTDVWKNTDLINRLQADQNKAMAPAR